MKGYLHIQVVLDKNKPKIQTVANKIDSIHNEYRTMQLEVLAGNHSLVTTLAENGLRFHVDLAIVYALFLWLSDSVCSKACLRLTYISISFHEVCIIFSRLYLNWIF